MSCKLESLQAAVLASQQRAESKETRVRVLEQDAQESWEVIAGLRRGKEEDATRFKEEMASMREKVGCLSAENDVLKGEVRAHMRVKQSTAEKLERVRRKLGLTTAESQHFVQVSRWDFFRSG